MKPIFYDTEIFSHIPVIILINRSASTTRIIWAHNFTPIFLTFQTLHNVLQLKKQKLQVPEEL